MENNTACTGMMKCEYSKLANIKPRTLARYLNIMYIDDLKKMDYTQNQRHLTPAQVSYLNKKLVITPDL